MSGLDYTKKHGLGNREWVGGLGRIRRALYRLVFLSRTRLEKWLLYTSLIFGGAGLALNIYLMSQIREPVPIQVNCDMDIVKGEFSKQNSLPNTGPESSVAESKGTKLEENKIKKTKSSTKKATSTPKKREVDTEKQATTTKKKKSKK